MSGIHLREIRIQNYKCFEDHVIKLSAPDGSTPGSGLNVLLGENGNGKTAILEAIDYANQSTFAAANRLGINDFTDYTAPIIITASTNPFVCKLPAPHFDCTFEATGITFQAKPRDRKSPGKLLSSPFSIKREFRPASPNYRKKDGSDSGKPIPPLSLGFSNSAIKDDELNVFFFDKNRTRQITTGTYKTTFERICDDLNWKFLNNLTQEEVEELLQVVSEDYFDRIISISQKGVGAKLAASMADFFEDERFRDLRIDTLDLLHPFSKAFFALRPEGTMTQISARDLGSGMEIILTLLLLRGIAGASRGGIVYLIDEPELHLHPSAQQKLAALLLEESSSVQIIVSTHSPYLIRGLMKPAVQKVVLRRDGDGHIVIRDTVTKVGNLFPWSPSWGEINYNAYDMPTVEFHNELYGWLQEKHSLQNESAVEAYLHAKGIPKSKSWMRERGGIAEAPYPTTLSTYVRNAIHHPENRHNTPFTETELTESIQVLISQIG
jgi:hypothetical protein